GIHEFCVEGDDHAILTVDIEQILIIRVDIVKLSAPPLGRVGNFRQHELRRDRGKCLRFIKNIVPRRPAADLLIGTKLVCSPLGHHTFRSIGTAIKYAGDSDLWILLMKLAEKTLELRTAVKRKLAFLLSRFKSLLPVCFPLWRFSSRRSGSDQKNRNERNPFK